MQQGRRRYRIMFNEITERAVKAAFLHPGKIDTNKVNAQQARRVLDRLVGYKLSPLLWEKVRRGLSAGRVQSVAVRLITEREREIAAFVPVEYWSLHARLKGESPPEFVATLKEVARAEGGAAPPRPTPRAVMAALEGAAVDREVGHAGRAAAEPGAAVHHLHAAAGREPQAPLHGEEDDDAGPAALRGHRARRGGRGGPHHLHAHGRGADGPGGAGGSPRVGEPGGWAASTCPTRRPCTGPRRARRRRTRRSGPSAVAREPKEVARYLSKDQLALYRLIWERFLASQMLPAVYDTVAADIEAGTCLFRAQGSTLKFAGFMAVYVESREDTDAVPEEEAEAVMPPLEVGEALTLLVARSQAALHPAAAALHGGLAGEDARGARHRAAVHLRADPLDHPGAGLRASRAGHAVPHRARDAGQRPARAALPRGDGRRVHRAARGVARQDRGGRRRLGGDGRAPSTSSSRATSRARRQEDGERQGRAGDGRGVSGVRQARGQEVRALRQAFSPARRIRSASTPRTSAGARSPPTSPPTRSARRAASRW